MKADAEYKKQMEELSHKDRKVKQAEKNKDSKGNDIKFGANMVKFEPPAAQRGGWWPARIDRKFRITGMKLADRMLWAFDSVWVHF